MGFIGDVFKAIANLIKGIVRGIADAIKWIGRKILPIAAVIFAGVVGGVGLAGLLGLGSVSSMLAGIGSFVKSIGAFTFKFVTGTFDFVVNAIKGLGSVVKSFMEFIHFKELLQLHKVAMILSKDYRQMMLKVYQEISKFSEQVFGWSQTLHMIIQNSRSFIYSVTSAVGFPTDVGEIEWLYTLDETLVKVSDNAERYMDNPEAVFDDMVEWVYKPLGDKYAEINSGFINTLVQVSQGLQATAEAVFDARQKLGGVIAYLPEPLRGNLDDRFEGVFSTIDRWQIDVYQPTVDRLDRALSEHSVRQQETQYRMQRLTNRLINPVDYLRELENLPPVQERDERRKLELEVSWPFRERSKEIDDRAEDVDRDWKERPHPGTERAPVSGTPEQAERKPFFERIVLPPAEPGWFVGDY